jgi:chemosensory pili system protein ChpA (sensor histidine kinase/response regulator)
LENADLDLLDECMNAMQSVAAHLDESTGFFQSHGALLGRIEQATEELDSRIIAAASAAEAAAAPAPVNAPPVPAAPAVAAPPASFQAPAPARELSTAAADIVEDVVTDFDQDIASIFTDEAVELIDAAQGALAQWNENRSSVDGLVALKRPLHTLKGGARMAGLIPMGDLSHELETLFMQIDSGVVAADDRAFQLAQTALDELARMREAVSGGKGVTTARGLIARIQHWVILQQRLRQPRSRRHLPHPAPVAAAPCSCTGPAVVQPAPKPAPSPVVSAPPPPPPKPAAPRCSPPYRRRSRRRRRAPSSRPSRRSSLPSGHRKKRR